MGSNFQTIVDRDASLEEARLLAQDIRDWLVLEKIIDRHMSDCVLGFGIGYPPGPNWRNAVDEGDKYAHFLRLQANELTIHVERRVHASLWGSWEVFCTECGGKLEDYETLQKTIRAWFEEQPDTLQCAHCGHADSVTEWVFDPPIGFGNLGFEFCNWPPLKPSFISEMTRRLTNRTVFVQGKI